MNQVLFNLIQTRSIWKMLGPFACEPPLHCQSPGVASRTPATGIAQAACDVHDDDDNNNNNNDNAWQRGPLWPHGMDDRLRPPYAICCHCTYVDGQTRCVSEQLLNGTSAQQTALRTIANTLEIYDNSCTCQASLAAVRLTVWKRDVTRKSWPYCIVARAAATHT